MSSILDPSGGDGPNKGTDPSEQSLAGDGPNRDIDPSEQNSAGDSGEEQRHDKGHGKGDKGDKGGEHGGGPKASSKGINPVQHSE